MPEHAGRPPKGRGANLQTPNPHLPWQQVDDFEHVADDEEFLASLGRKPTTFLRDDTQSIVAENNSPDIGFRYSVNPYRGCEHGCSYCYARPSHEFLGYSAGVDFESKILVKENAAELLRKWLAKPSWQPETISFSGVTDCYQPAERKFHVTRQCLEVVAECRQPVGIVTKNALVCRDLDLLIELARFNAVLVAVSLTTLDEKLARVMEPRTSSPAARLRAIRELTEAGIPVMAMTAPIVPGLTDHEIPQLLTAARDAGAVAASYVLLRLPLAVLPIFASWLQTHQPDRAERVKSFIRQSRDGKMNDSQFGRRMRGSGFMADQIANTYRLFARKLGLDRSPPSLSTEHFRRPGASGQQWLFE